MNLDQAFTQIANDLNLDPNLMIGYAREDTIGGYHEDLLQRRWMMGSMWEVEGQFLYSLVRTMKPDLMIEIGTWVGCSATHILEAMAMNNKGTLLSIDIDPLAGREIPPSLRKRWQFIEGRAQDVLSRGNFSDPDIVLEDASHELDDTVEILTAMRDHTQPKFYISHDGEHYVVGETIRTAYQRVFGMPPKTVLIEPGNCGFAYEVRK